MLEGFLSLAVVQLSQFLNPNGLGSIVYIGFRQHVDDIFLDDSHKKDGLSPYDSPLLS